MKVKTSGLAGAALDWAVEYIKGGCKHEPHANYWLERWVDPERRYLCESASTEWLHGGPIIEREEIDIYCYTSPKVSITAGLWLANITGTKFKAYGSTPLIAVMRCYVASKLGAEVDIPEDLLK